MRLARHSLLPLLAALLVPILVGCATAPATWTYAPAPSKAAPSAVASAGASAAASASGNIQITASGVKFVETDVAVPAGTAFKIDFANNDPSTPHDIVIHKGDANGPIVLDDKPFPGVATKTFDVPALDAGAYVFVCTVHAGMQGNMTAG